MMSVSASSRASRNLNMSISRASGEKIQLESQLRFLREPVGQLATSPCRGRFDGGCRRTAAGRA